MEAVEELIQRTGVEVRDRPRETRRRFAGLAVAAAGQVAVLAALSAGVGLGPAGWLVATAYATAGLALLASAMRRAGMRSMGPANVITAARATLVGGVVALVADRPEPGPPVVALVALAVVAMLLDAVDGEVARRTGTVSPLGARFDMEVDAALLLALSVHVALMLDPWMAAIGALRYAYVAAGLVLPWLRAPLPPSLARRLTGAGQGVLLVVLGTGLVPPTPAAVTAGTAMTLLVWSFGRDVVRLRRSAQAGARS